MGRPHKNNKEYKMLKKKLLLTVTICAVASLAFAQFRESKLTSGDAAEFDEFGVSVSISGDYAIVGLATKTKMPWEEKHHLKLITI